MRYSAVSTLAFIAAAVASPVAQGKSPSTSAPAGCSANHPGKFQIQVVNVTSSAKRSLDKRQDGKLEITLANGVLTDEKGRIGNIVANHQFQFDPAPGQAGAIYTSGWSACANSSLAIGGNAIFYECLSGDFYNLYDEANAPQCYAVYVEIVGAAVTSATGVASVASDGQPTVTSAAKVSQTSDGQLQAPTSAATVSQISDGQIQATTSAAKVSQISDGQIQASTKASAPVTQLPDGQIQAPTSTASPVSQIGDGQIQAPTSSAAPVSQIGDGQIQAGNATRTTSTPAVYTGSANVLSAAGVAALGLFGLALAL